MMVMDSVQSVVTGSAYTVEYPAGGRVRRFEKASLRRRLAMVARDAGDAAIGEVKGRDVDGVGSGAVAAGSVDALDDFRGAEVAGVDIFRVIVIGPCGSVERASWVRRAGTVGIDSGGLVGGAFGRD